MCSWTAFTPPNAAPPSVFPPANKVLMSATAALIVDTGLVHSIPNESKVALSPGPIPKVALPFEISSMVAIAEAEIAGLLTYGLVMLKFRIRFYCCSGL